MNRQERLEFVREYEPDYRDAECVIPNKLLEAIRRRYKANTCYVRYNKTLGRRYVFLTGSPYLSNGTAYARAIYAVVHGQPKPDEEVDHKNINRLDDRIDNLQLLTIPAHKTKCIEEGSCIFGLKGSDRHNAKLTDKQVLRLRKLYAKKGGPLYSVQDCLDELGLDIHSKTAKQIISGGSWKHVGGPISSIVVAIQKRDSFTEEEVVRIRRLYARGGISANGIISKLKLSAATSQVTAMIAGRTYAKYGGPIKGVDY